MAKKVKKSLHKTTIGVLCSCYNYIIGIPTNTTGKLFSKEKPTYEIENQYGWTDAVYEFDFGDFEACVTIGPFPFGNMYPSKETCDRYAMLGNMFKDEDKDFLQAIIHDFVVDCIEESRAINNADAEDDNNKVKGAA